MAHVSSRDILIASLKRIWPVDDHTTALMEKVPLIKLSAWSPRAVVKMILSTTDNIETEFIDALERFLASIEIRHDIHSVWLFGSRVRETSYSNRDVDVAIVLHEMSGSPFTAACDISEDAFEVLLDTGVNINALAISREDWLRPEGSASVGLIEEIKRDGMMIALKKNDL